MNLDTPVNNDNGSNKKSADSERVVQLIYRAQKGDRRAFDALLKEYRPRVVGYCIKRLNCKGDWEDVTQRAFVQAWENIEKFRLGSPIIVWLLRIARNVYADLLRRNAKEENKKGPSLDDPDTPMKDDSLLSPDDPEKAVIEAERNARLLQIVRECIEAARRMNRWGTLDNDIYILWYKEGLHNVSEIARLVQRHPNVVGYRKRHRVDRVLAVAIKKFRDEENFF